MNRILASALLAFAVALATPADASAAADKFEGALPATVAGKLLVEVPAEDVEENDERVALGTLVADDASEYAVEIPEDVLKGAALPAEGGQVKATFGEESEEFGFPMYRVTALEKL